MKHILITTIAAVLLVGCSDPEKEANKLFTEASQLVKDADAITEPYSLEAYNKRKAAVELLEKIPVQYPQSSLSVEISKGDFKVQGQSTDEIREKMKPDITIQEAVEKGDIEALKQHFEAGTDVNAKDDSGGTLLHPAVYYGHKEIAKLLLSYGVDVNARMKGGFTSLDLVEMSRMLNEDKGGPPEVKAAIKEMADFLREHGGKSGAEDSIIVAVTVGNIEAVTQHLAAGADVNATDEDGKTPLYWAAENGRKEIVELLIKNGAEVNARVENRKHHSENSLGLTPLDVAVEKSETETADLLRKHGALTAAQVELVGARVPFELPESILVNIKGGNNKVLSAKVGFLLKTTVHDDAGVKLMQDHLGKFNSMLVAAARSYFVGLDEDDLNAPEKVHRDQLKSKLNIVFMRVRSYDHELGNLLEGDPVEEVFLPYFTYQ